MEYARPLQYHYKPKKGWMNDPNGSEVRDIKILRDEYILEIFVNGGETVYSILLC